MPMLTQPILVAVLTALVAAAVCAAAPASERVIDPGNAGFYTVEGSSVSVASDEPGPVTLRLVARKNGVDQPPDVLAVLDPGDTFTFDCFLGYLDEGDQVSVTLTAASGQVRAQTRADWAIKAMPAIPVFRFPVGESVGPEVEWTMVRDVPAASMAARHLAIGHSDHTVPVPQATQTAVTLPLPAAAGVEQILAVRAPQSGFYALHEAVALAKDHPAVMRIYRHGQSEPVSVAQIPADQRTSVNAEIGYVAKGTMIYLAFSSATAQAGQVEFGARLVEWAPRRPPLRVYRGTDGYLDVVEPAAPDKLVNVPPSRWIEVKHSQEDTTAAIRQAIARATELSADGSYAGVRLVSGETYLIGSGQSGGQLFDIKAAKQLVIDGNGATLMVNSPDSQREGIRLFNVLGSRDIAIADLTIDSKTPPAYAIGEVLAVSPMNKGNQTVTFRTLPGSADPLGDIARSGNASGYAYDPAIPGRPAHNAWAHYPGAPVTPQIRAGSEPGTFEHTVTRTDSTIQTGSRWLIKNKKAGIWYLVTDSRSENVTLARVTARAAGGGLLRFWQTSGVSVLDCRVEPDANHWIASTSDGIHGRGRESVWIENTLTRGICEDILNIYGPNLVVVAEPGTSVDGNVLPIRFLARQPNRDHSPRPLSDMVSVGDPLVFLNPQNGHILGYASVTAVAEGLVTLSNPIPDIDTWAPGDGLSATMVYNNALAARFFIRDSRFMDSMRFGAFIKARGGVIFNTHFEGLPASAIYAANEPEYPEGPPPSYLWLQGNTFSQNNFGYNSRSRTHLQADPADVSIFTRRLRDTSAAQPFLGSTVRGEYSTSHMKVIGNVFHDWRGMGIAARNVRNLHVIGNLFLSPLEDAGLRKTLAADPANSADGAGLFTGIFLDSVAGGRVADNTLVTPDATTRLLGEGTNVRGIEASNNRTLPASARPDELRFDFAEWFGPRSTSRCGGVQLELSNVRRGVGQLGAGLWFAGDGAATTPPTGPIAEPTRRCTIALWVKPTSPAAGQILLARTSEEGGLVLLLDGQRLRAGVWSRGVEEWIDLGPAFQNAWQHVAVTYDGQARRFTGYVNGRKVASGTSAPEALPAATDPIRLGSPTPRTRTGPSAKPAPGPAAFHGGLDELRISPAALDEPDPSAVLHANR